MNEFGITLEQARAFLGYTPTGSPPSHPRDATIEVLLAGAIATLQSLLGRNLVYGVYEDTFQRIEQRTYLTEPPVERIISVTNAETLLDETDYLFFAKHGYLFFQNDWWPTGHMSRWLQGQGGVFKVAYIGGYQTLPGDMLLAVLNGIQSADSYQKQISSYGGTVKRISVYDVGVTDLAVPREGSVNVMSETMASQLGQYIDGAAGGLTGYLLRESEYLGGIGTVSP